MKSKLENVLYFGLCGFVLGLMASFFLGFSVWVEMRINLANFIVAGTVIGVIVGLFKKANRYWVFFALEGLLLAVAMATGRSSRIIYLFKDLLIEFGTSIKAISFWIVPVALIANTAVLIIALKNKKRKARGY